MSATRQNRNGKGNGPKWEKKKKKTAGSSEGERGEDEHNSLLCSILQFPRTLGGIISLMQLWDICLVPERQAQAQRG